MNYLQTRNKLDRQLIYWVIFLCFAYQYKAVACGFLGIICGIEFICYTMVHGISTNHWFETLIYAPLMWITVSQINEIVFFPKENDLFNQERNRRKRFGQFLCAIYLFGMGIHVTNTLELYSREHLGIFEGALYEQIFWLDEKFSHWIQIGAFFLLMTWFILNDRLDRVHGSYVAIFTGISHGVERGIRVIEGSSAVLALALTVLIFIATIYRWHMHNRDLKRSWADFFFRHGLTFSITTPLTIVIYNWTFNGFVQPSEMGIDAWKVFAFSLILFSVLFIFSIGMDKVFSVRVGKKVV